MSLKNLTDNELSDFIRDPNAFLKNPKQFVKALGLQDPETRKRLEEMKEKHGLVWTDDRSPQPKID